VNQSSQKSPSSGCKLRSTIGATCIDASQTKPLPMEPDSPPPLSLLTTCHHAMDSHANVSSLGSDIAAMARKRRIELRNQQRASNHNLLAAGAPDNQSIVSIASESDADIESADEGVNLQPPRKKVRGGDDVVGAKNSEGAFDASEKPQKQQPSLTGIKKNSRYDPGVPMTREELTAWRKEKHHYSKIPAI